MRIAPALLASVLLSSAAAAQPAPSYQVVQRLPGPDGGWDIATFDPVRRRVYVARTDSVMAIDADTGAVSRLASASRAHEVLPLPGGREVLESDGATDTARLIDAATGQIVAAIPTGKNPDAEEFDPATGQAFVMNGGSGDITVVDPIARRATATIPVGGKLEFGAADGRGHLYVNVEDKAEIAVIDTRTRRVTHRYKLAGCEEPSGLAYAADSGLLIAACGNGAAKVIRARDGKDIATVPIGRGPDTALYDAARKVALIPAGRDGVLEVISLANPSTPTVAHVPTARSARTGALDPRTGRVYLSSASYGPAPAGGGRPSMQPGSFTTLVVSPSH